MKYMAIKEIQKKFQQQFPDVAVGIGVGPSLQVRTKDQSQADNIPKTFMNIPVVTLVVGTTKAL